MHEELLEFENTVEDEEGRSHRAVVLGRERRDGTWIGWIRFETAEREVLETERETTQPNRKDLAYWAKGLTYPYLEGALARAKRRGEREAGAGGGGERAGTAATTGSGPATAGADSAPGSASRPVRHAPRLDVLAAGHHVAGAVMGVPEPRPGMSREVPNGGVVVYEGGEREGDRTRERFVVHYGSENGAALLANWLWSRLHESAAEVLVDGERVELTNDALKQALVGR